MARFEPWLHGRRGRLVFPSAVLVVYGVVYLVWTRPLDAVLTVDYWLHMGWARQLSLARPESLVHPFYPAGYFAVLRLGLEAGLDMARYGQFLSWAGSLLALVAVYGLVARGTGSEPLAAAGTLLLAVHPFFLYQATRQGTDMLAAGLLLVAILLLFLARDRALLGRALAAGAVLGLAYHIRLTSLLFLPLGLLLLLLFGSEVGRRRLAAAGLFATAFLLVSAPQLVASAIVEGNPFHNNMVHNVWFGLYGDFDWDHNWSQFPPDTTLISLVRDDPGGVLSHWAFELGRVLGYDAGNNLDALGWERFVTFWHPLPMHLLWLVGSFVVAYDARLSRRQRALLLGALAGLVAAPAVAWLFNRFLIVPLALQAVIIALAVSRLAGPGNGAARGGTWLGVAALVICLAVVQLATPWRERLRQIEELTAHIALVDARLAALGVTAPDQAITNNRLFQQLSAPDHPRYAVFRSHDNDPALTVEQFLERITRELTGEFLVFDWGRYAVRTFDFAPYREQLGTHPGLLRPLIEEPELSIYCRQPCAPPGGPDTSP